MNVDRLMRAMKRKCVGLKITSRIKQNRPGVPVWVWTAWVSPATKVEIRQFSNDLEKCDVWVLGDPSPTDWDSSHSPLTQRLKTMTEVCDYLNGGK